MSFVQAKTLGSPHPGTSFAMTMTSSTTNGNSLHLLIATTLFGTGVSSITDNKGNTFVKIGTVNHSTPNILLEMWYAIGIVGGASHIITINQSTDNNTEVVIEEHSGVGPLRSFDRFTSAGGTATTADSGNTATTRNANEMVWGGASIYAFNTDFSNSAVSLGSGFSNLNNAALVIYTESKYVALAGVQNATYGISSGGLGFSSGSPDWVVMVATFADTDWEKKTKTHTTDSLKRKQTTLAHTTDAYRRIQVAKTHTTSANKRKVTTRSHTTDSLLGFTKNHTTDALKRGRIIRQYLTDALKHKAPRLTHTTDARLVLRPIKFHTTNVLKYVRPFVTHTTDLYLRRTSAGVPRIKSIDPDHDKPRTKG